MHVTEKDIGGEQNLNSYTSLADVMSWYIFGDVDISFPASDGNNMFRVNKLRQNVMPTVKNGLPKRSTNPLKII